MKQSKFITALLLAGAVFLSSCIDTNKDIKYNKYTKADTEAFTFLKKTYEQALFQQYAAKTYNLGAESQKITQVYKSLSEELVNLATKNNVLMPSFGSEHFAEKAGINTSVPAKRDTLPVDTNLREPLVSQADVNELPQAPAPKLNEVVGKVGQETPSQKVIHSQEEIVHQFEVASRNTNLSVRHFAESKLTELESLLEQTKSSIK